MKLIDKDALVAEIEKRIKNLYPKVGQGMVVTKILKDHYEDLLDLINTIEVIELGVDVGSPEGDWSSKTVQVIDANSNILIFNKAQKGDK